MEPYASFDSAATRLEKRLRRYNRRLKDHHGHKNGSAPGNGMFADYVLEAPDQEADEAEEFNPVVVAEKSSALQTLPVSEAVLQLDLTGAPVVVFLHATSERVNIVYRRADGNIGWIDPTAGEKTA